VAEGARLESVCTRKGTQGSNPCLSAIQSQLQRNSTPLLLKDAKRRPFRIISCANWARENCSTSRLAAVTAVFLRSVHW